MHPLKIAPMSTDWPYFKLEVMSVTLYGSFTELESMGSSTISVS